MRFVCLWSPAWWTGGGPGAEGAPAGAGASGAAPGPLSALAALPLVLAEVAPRLRVERERVWVDGRGLPPVELAYALLRALASIGVPDARAGLADVPVAAWAAARVGSARAPAGDEVGEAPGRPEAEGECGGVGVWGNAAPAGPARASESRAASGTPAVSGAHVAHTPTLPHSHTGRIALIPPGEERSFLAPLPLDLLLTEGVDPRLLEMLASVGMATCGALAEQEREALEVRFGAEGLHLWRLARGDDPRLLFQAIPPERPQASLDFVDYVVTDPERLAFTVNALLGSICDGLREHGEHARRLLLVLELAGGGRWEQGLRPGRATASRAVWLRLARAALDRTTLPDAVAGVRLEVEATEPAAVRQGDLFDAGFATAVAVEVAVLRLLESQGEVVVRPEVDGHPLAERRVRWQPLDVDEAVSATAPGVQASDGVWECGSVGVWEKPASSAGRRSWAAGLPKGRRKRADAAVPLTPTLPHSPTAGEAEARPGPALTLQLLDSPRDLHVETELRRDHGVPIRYRDRDGWHQVVSAAGPDRVSGGLWEDAYAREYFRVVTDTGLLAWIFRDARRGTWHLHGWWD